MNETAGMTLRRADAADIAFIMQVERQPDYERIVGRWNADQHAEALASPDNVYLIGSAEERRGFAILADMLNAADNIYLRRVAILDPGQGFGTRFVGAVADWVFHETAAHRLWLNVLSHNVRAQRAYAKCGFSDDGVQRQSFRAPDGTRSDQRLMSILRPEWEALRRAV